MDELHYQIDLLKAMNGQLGAKERMYRLVCETVEGAFLYCTLDRDELVMIGCFRDFFGFDVRAVRDLNRLIEMVDDDSRDQFIETLFPERDRHASACMEVYFKEEGVWYLFSTKILPDEKGKPSDKIISIQDITKEKAKNAELLYMAYYDSLTGIYNRIYFVSLLSEFISKAKENDDVVAILTMDIDDFKKVNDGLGMMIGDELLQQFGAFLKELSDNRVLPCHMGNDIFSLAIYNPIGEYSIESIYHRIRTKLETPFHMSSGQDVLITVSFSVALFPESAGSALELINCADVVMFRCKSAGKNTLQYFDPSMLNEFLRNVDIENRLKDAVFQNNFEIYYQPQYYAGNKSLRGFEALVRWKDPLDGLISPAVFIPIAEKNGSIVSIGKYVVEESIKQYALWKGECEQSFILSINISALQYKRDDFVESIMHVLHEHKVDPSLIELEITESILIDDFEEVTNKLNRLRSFGIRISLDDFGTGYSSLSYLKRFPIDTLKIDKSFIDTVLGDASTRIITESIVNMTHTMGFETIAEGVETQKQYEYLHAIGCDVIQGFLLGRPMPVEEVTDLLKGI